ncbi:hypothetical protein WA158_002020 [Blastocystis sp. Blastoise]
MTAGSYCYIGPQGIVHGTTITVLNAGRKYLGVNDMKGKVYISSGLGGMSGKAALIAGCIGVIAELIKLLLISVSTKDGSVNKARKEGSVVAYGFLGNIVDVWERFAEEEELLVDLGSDQTSLHNPYMGGYYPAGMTEEESRIMMRENPELFKQKVWESLRRQVIAINKLTARGMRFWDYGNSFLLESSRAGADILAKEGEKNYGVGGFKYPSYVQDIMGDIFSLGFGPFRWDIHEDLVMSDKIAGDIFEELLAENPPEVIQAQLRDNLHWIRHADENKMVVGSEARILYADGEGRMKIARAFNNAVAKGIISAPIVLGRDHHDVSGTDSPYRETSNITDGSAYCADMAIQNVIGDAARGATWVSIHNGGGVGWGEVINGGFGFLLDGSRAADIRAQRMLFWDVQNGISRRAWARNDNAVLATKRAMDVEPLYTFTKMNDVNEEVLEKISATF